MRRYVDRWVAQWTDGSTDRQANGQIDWQIDGSLPVCVRPLDKNPQTAPSRTAEALGASSSSRTTSSRSGSPLSPATWQCLGQTTRLATQALRIRSLLRDHVRGVLVACAPLLAHRGRGLSFAIAGHTSPLCTWNHIRQQETVTRLELPISTRTAKCRAGRREEGREEPRSAANRRGKALKC